MAIVMERMDYGLKRQKIGITYIKNNISVKMKKLVGFLNIWKITKIFHISSVY